MWLRDYFETLDVSRIHAGENAPHAYLIPFDRAQDATLPREESARFTLLNGLWDFRFYESVHDLPEDYAPQRETMTATMPVPGVWQLHGFDRPQYTNVRYPFPYDPPYTPAENPCGLYRRHFTLDKQTDARYQLCFEGVDSCLFVWVNERFAGFSEVSHAPAEFDVTEALRSGENTVCALVVKWCAGSYFEDQDKFRYSGIFRDVYLLRRDRVHVRDFSVRTELDGGAARVRVQASLSDSGGVCRAALYTPKGDKLDEQETGEPGCVFILDKPALWTAETPILYTLRLFCGGETIAQRVGVRQIEIRNEVVLFNGRPVRLRGVNLHESSCEEGAYTTPAHIRCDLAMMKRCNINAVRTSHYPQPPLFYQLCDEMGLYVLDEADLECHGVVTIHGDSRADYNLIADDPAFEAVIADRVRRMVVRDQNFSCVLIYSMGNEAGYGVNFERALRWTKRFDPSRLTHYERASFPPAGQDVNRTDLDLYSRMYPSPDEIRRYFTEHTVCKPYILCEYAHAMGNGPGDLEDYFRVFAAEDRIVGAFVWEWCDHAPRVDDGVSGRRRFRYGGDFGETLHDGNFCVDGLVSSDRAPHPGLLEYRNVLRPLRVVEADLARGRLVFKSYLDFISSKELVEVTCLLENGERLPLALDVPPRGVAEARLPRLNGGSCRIRLTLKNDTAWAKAGTLLGEEQLGKPLCAAEAGRAGGALRLENAGGRRVTVTGEGFAYTYDTMTGVFCALQARGQELLTRPMQYNLFRAPTDNDRNLRAQWASWQLRYAQSRGFETQIEETEQGVVLRTQLHIGAQGMCTLLRGTVAWTVGGDGRIACALALQKAPEAPALPRVGLRLFLPGAMRALRYFAIGPQESYADKRRAGMLGWYESTIDAQYAHPLRPQESGGHAGARSLTVSGGAARLRVTGTEFFFSALPYTQEQLCDTAHDDELRETDECVLCLDAAHSGVGSASCGPALARCYQTGDEIAWRIALDPLA